MNCLRCGRDTAEGSAFCPGCQEIMTQYPVAPGTAIHLPRRAAPSAVKKRPRRKRQFSQEEQLFHLRKALRQARVFLVLVTIVLCLAVGMIFYQNFQLTGPVIGRNYTIDTTQQTD